MDRTWNSAWNDEPQDLISLRFAATVWTQLPFIKLGNITEKLLNIVGDLLMYIKAYSKIYLKNSKFEFLAYFFDLFVALLQEAHFPKGIKQKSFQCEIRAIFT